MKRSLLVLLLLAACQAPTLDVEVPFAVVQWSPPAGASGVCPGWPVSVCFSEPLDPSTLGSIILGPASSCAPGATLTSEPSYAVAIESGNPNCAVIQPPAPGLTPGTCYALEVEGLDVTGAPAAGALPDGGTDPLPVTLRSVFQVAADSSACLMPDAG